MYCIIITMDYIANIDQLITCVYGIAYNLIIFFLCFMYYYVNNEMYISNCSYL